MVLPSTYHVSLLLQWQCRLAPRAQSLPRDCNHSGQFLSLSFPCVFYFYKILWPPHLFPGAIWGGLTRGLALFSSSNRPPFFDKILRLSVVTEHSFRLGPTVFLGRFGSLTSFVPFRLYGGCYLALRECGCLCRLREGLFGLLRLDCLLWGTLSRHPYFNFPSALLISNRLPDGYMNGSFPLLYRPLFK